jgi:hypothetical protein
MSAHFSEREFACRCGRGACEASARIAPALIQTLETMRAAYGAPITITSGARCPAWNAQVGGVPDSEHITDPLMGADLACPSSRQRWEMVTAALAAGFRRLGIGPDFLHVGVAEPPAHEHEVIWTYYRTPGR